MKYLYLLAIPFLLLLPSCQDDEPDNDNELNYAGVNATSPFLPQGTYIMAARFPSNITQNYTDKLLDAVEVEMYDLPGSIEMIVYEGGSATAPGTPVRNQILQQGEIFPNLAVTVFLDEPLEISGNDLWLAFRFSHGSEQQTIGCDAGPRQRNGDMFFDEEIGTWSTYEEITGESINWNIKGILTNP